MNKDDFIGASILNITYTSNEMVTMIVETDRGSFEIIAYNDHNGYYPHHVYLSFNKYFDYIKV